MGVVTTRPLAAVTGASDGIGYELAAELARRGYDLVIAAEDDGITEAARAFESRGATVRKVQVDLTSYDGVEALYQEIQAAGKPLALAALNAGVGVNGDFARETSLDDELKLIELNVTSTVHLAKRILADMARRGEGRLLITSSVVARMPGAYTAVYGASKAFLLSFAEAIREELKDSGITVTALLPGATETNFFHRAHMEHTQVGASEKDDPALVARQGIEGLLAGKDKVLAGSASTRLQGAASALLPDTVTAAMHAKQARPGSAREQTR